MKHLFLLILCAAFTACGSNYRATGARGAVPTGSKVSIKATSDDADPGIRNAIKAELAHRGLRTVEDQPADALPLTYHDEWKWDIVMYLWSLNIQIAEPRTGKILAVGDFGHFGIHHYPNSRSVVRELFEEMDSKGIFQK